MKRDLQVNDLEYEKAIIQYRQTIYQAFADVENALSNRTELTKQVALQQRNVELAERTERLTEVRYRNGAIALKNLLDAQETTRNARLALVQTRQNQYNAYVTLMQALGGSPSGNCLESNLNYKNRCSTAVFSACDSRKIIAFANKHSHFQ